MSGRGNKLSISGRGNTIPKEIKIARGTSDKSPEQYYAQQERKKKKKFEDTEEKRLTATPPSHLADNIKKIWKSIHGSLVMKEIAVVESDRTSFEMLCSMYAEWRETGDKIEEARENGEKDTKVSKLVNERWGQYSKILPFLKEFGLTPRSREAMQNARGRKDNETKELTEDDKFLEGLMAE